MEWSREAPAEPGWWWLDYGEGPVVARVEPRPGCRSDLLDCYAGRYTFSMLYLKDVEAMWAGPIVPPKVPLELAEDRRPSSKPPLAQ